MSFTFLDWNKQQKALREALVDPSAHQEAMNIALSQHGWTHQAVVSGSEEPTFADQLWEDLDEESARIIPDNEEQSIAWNIYHLARIEDTAMNFLVAEKTPVFDQGGWMGTLGSPFADSGNLIPDMEMAALSQSIDLDALRSYRAAVGVRTREIIESLTLERLNQKVSLENIQRIREAAVIRPEAEDVLTYWSKRTIEGLVLMPATRHNMVHLNGALRLKEKLMRRKK